MIPNPTRRARWWALVPLLLAACSGQAVGPHGGVLLTIDPGELCVEVCVERTAGKLSLCFTGGDGKTPLAIEAEDVTDVNITSGDTTSGSKLTPERGKAAAIAIGGLPAAQAPASVSFRYQGLLLQAELPAEGGQ